MKVSKVSRTALHTYCFFLSTLKITVLENIIIFCKDLCLLLYVKYCFPVIGNSYLVLERCSGQDRSTSNPRSGSARLEVRCVNGTSPSIPLPSLKGLIHLTIFWDSAFGPPFICTGCSPSSQPPASSSALFDYENGP